MSREQAAKQELEAEASEKARRTAGAAHPANVVARGARSESCPICAALSAYIAPETVDIGVGEIPIEPDQWKCPTHGRWCLDASGATVVEYTDTTAQVAL